MINKPQDEIDQVARLGRELRDGSWLSNARSRAQRRKSVWNLLLPLFGLPLWVFFTFLLVKLGTYMHQMFHPAQAQLFTNGPLHLNAALVLFPSIIATLCPAFLLANQIVYLLPPARRTLNAEAQTTPGTSYMESQRALFKVGLWAIVLCGALLVSGAVIG
ncbi:MAG: hypothetical protein LBQ20_08745 [Rhodanobacter sp.]|jgi:hypothetical protein|nr:hypothetical protein [Rhodanobacter sp.]